MSSASSTCSALEKLLPFERLVEAATVDVGNLRSHGPQVRRKLPTMMHVVVLRELQIQERRHGHDAEEGEGLKQVLRRHRTHPRSRLLELGFIPFHQTRDCIGWLRRLACK